MENVIEILKTTIVAVLFGVFCYYIFLMYSIKARLKKQHPELWKKLTYRPESFFGKELFEFTNMGVQMDGSALMNFIKNKIYLELDDEILIRKASRARFFLYSSLYVFIGYIFFMWISALYRHCEGVAPRGWGAVWDCLIAIP